MTKNILFPFLIPIVGTQPKSQVRPTVESKMEYNGHFKTIQWYFLVSNRSP